MSLLKRLFGNSGPDPKLKLVPLYNQIVAKARQPHWYIEGQVPDSIDGRFDMVAAILSLVLLRLERDPDQAQAQDMVYVTELFVDDMDGQLRQSGIGDVIVGKHMGKMLGAVGGRLGAFREADSDPVKLDEAILRNCYRNESVDPAAFGHVRTALQDVIKALAAQSSAQIISGDAAW